MSRNWYPIIDYDNCVGCLSCVKFCPHGVYEIEGGKPSVVRPENCVEFCKGCQRGACESKAINYFGE